MQFKDKLKQVRESTGMSQCDAAARVDWEHNVISEYETGRRSPRVESVIKLCRALGCEPNDLIDVE